MITMNDAFKKENEERIGQLLAEIRRIAETAATGKTDAAQASADARKAPARQAKRA
ncbi:hypothetical protein STVA_14260 [Allostella vacuolata]|nr:hypothetical protein STVA_14260 [Stella vacuolata]